jgi:hypothetical protein
MSETVLVGRRMDRVEGNKLPMEDMCQLTDRLTEEKYRGYFRAFGAARKLTERQVTTRLSASERAWLLR